MCLIYLENSSAGQEVWASVLSIWVLIALTIELPARAPSCFLSCFFILCSGKFPWLYIPNVFLFHLSVSGGEWPSTLHLPRGALRLDPLRADPCWGYRLHLKATWWVLSGVPLVTCWADPVGVRGFSSSGDLGLYTPCFSPTGVASSAFPTKWLFPSPHCFLEMGWNPLFAAGLPSSFSVIMVLPVFRTV